MITLASFTFNPFQENTFVLFDESKEAVVIDPGCYTPEEKKLLSDFIDGKELKPVRLLNTHCHIDHVLGNKYIAERYGLELEMHKGEIPVLEAVLNYGTMMGLQVEESPKAGRFLDEHDVIEFGNSKLEIRFTPGHSPASICFYSPADQFIIAGDTLFEGSIGRTDLPGGDMDTLMKSIERELLSLPDETRVYPGHGSHTTVGVERKSNMFILQYLK